MSTMNFSKSEKPCPKEKIIGTPIQCRWTVEDDFAHGREFQVYLTGKNQLGNVTKTYDVIPENYGNTMFYFYIHVLLNCDSNFIMREGVGVSNFMEVVPAA